jgi:hypothetical protein
MAGELVVVTGIVHASVEATDQRHMCCGQNLIVVAITFADPVVADIFSQTVASARADAATAVPPFPDQRTQQPFGPPVIAPPTPLSDTLLWKWEDGVKLGPGHHAPANCMRELRENERTCWRLHGPPSGPDGIGDPSAFATCFCISQNLYRRCLDPYAAVADCNNL